MRLTHFAAQDYRNLPLVRLELAGADAHFFLGPNGQGKTNLLEALGLLTALRSFRGAEGKALVRWEQPGAVLRYGVQHEQLGETTIALRLLGVGKELEVDGARATRLGEFLGRFPVVVLSSPDAQLLRGNPAGRRRFLDLVLSCHDATYFQALRDYHAALADRNALLKGAQRGPPPTAQLDAFEQVLAPAAALLVARRQAGLAELAAELVPLYAATAGVPEAPELVYEPDEGMTEAAAWRSRWAESRPRDLALGSTSRGPHRDDFDLRLFGRSARESGSEGQQRGLVLALRLAQWWLWQRRAQVRPVLLADDVLNELDPLRRAAFWQALPPETQVFATGTRVPDPIPGRAWKLWQVAQGTVVPASTAVAGVTENT